MSNEIKVGDKVQVAHRWTGTVIGLHDGRAWVEPEASTSNYSTVRLEYLEKVPTYQEFWWGITKDGLLTVRYADRQRARRYWGDTAVALLHRKSDGTYEVVDA